MVVCASCGGNCDNGELVQGVCPECMEMLENERLKAKDVLIEEARKYFLLNPRRGDGIWKN